MNPAVAFWPAVPLVLLGACAVATLAVGVVCACAPHGDEDEHGCHKSKPPMARVHSTDDGALILTFPRRLRLVQDALDATGDQVNGEVFPASPGDTAA